MLVTEKMKNYDWNSHLQISTKKFDWNIHLSKYYSQKLMNHTSVLINNARPIELLKTQQE